jgi:hypothetical protein
MVDKPTCERCYQIDGRFCDNCPAVLADEPYQFVVPKHCQGEADEIFIASSYTLFICGSCPNVHIALHDDEKVTVAIMTIGPDQIERTFEDAVKLLHASRNLNARRQNRA